MAAQVLEKSSEEHCNRGPKLWARELPLHTRFCVHLRGDRTLFPLYLEILFTPSEEEVFRFANLLASDAFHRL